MTRLPVAASLPAVEKWMKTDAMSECGGGVATRLVIDVVSGDALPVAWAGVQAVYRYRNGSQRTERGRTDADGRLVLRSIHDELPLSVAIRVEGQPQGLHRVRTNMRVVAEL